MVSADPPTGTFYRSTSCPGMLQKSPACDVSLTLSPADNFQQSFLQMERGLQAFGKFVPSAVVTRLVSQRPFTRDCPGCHGAAHFSNFGVFLHNFYTLCTHFFIFFPVHFLSQFLAQFASFFRIFAHFFCDFCIFFDFFCIFLKFSKFSP